MNCHFGMWEGRIFFSGNQIPGSACNIRTLAAVVIIVVSLPLTAQDSPKAVPPPAPHDFSETTQLNTQLSSQLYRNTTFGFRYQIPYGWVDRTKAMQSEDEPGKAGVLLAVFEHPPEATVNSVNAAVVIASESAAFYPRLRKAEDYLGPLTELAIAKGMESDGEPSVLSIDAHEVVRADFVKPLNDKLAMHQCTLVILMKGQIVSFTLIAGSEDELQVLVEGVHFGVPKSGGR